MISAQWFRRIFFKELHKKLTKLPMISLKQGWHQDFNRIGKSPSKKYPPQIGSNSLQWFKRGQICDIT